MEDYVLEQIIDRLEMEPDLVERSIEMLRKKARIDMDLLEELGTLESDPDVVDEALSITRVNVEQASYESMRLIMFYLIDYVGVNAPSLPLDEQIEIFWRVPETGSGNAEDAGNPSTS